MASEIIQSYFNDTSIPKETRAQVLNDLNSGKVDEAGLESAITSAHGTKYGAPSTATPSAPSTPSQPSGAVKTAASVLNAINPANLPQTLMKGLSAVSDPNSGISQVLKHTPEQAAQWDQERATAKAAEEKKYNDMHDPVNLIKTAVTNPIEAMQNATTILTTPASPEMADKVARMRARGPLNFNIDSNEPVNPDALAMQKDFSAGVDRDVANLGQAVNKGLEAEKNTSFIDRGINTAKAAIGGVQNVVGGLGDVLYGATPIPRALNPWDNRSWDEASQQGVAGISKIGNGLMQTLSAPLEQAPIFKQIASLPFEKADEATGGVLQYLGLDPNSPSFKNIKDAIMTAGGLGLGMKEVGTEGMNMKGAVDTLKGTGDFLKEAPQLAKDYVSNARIDRIINGRLEDLTKLQSGNAQIRKAIASSEAKGVDVKGILSKTDLLKDSVDTNGRINTENAIQQLNEFIRPQEDVIANNLRREGVTIPFSTVEEAMNKAIEDSGLKAGNKIDAQKRVARDLKGLQLEVDANGNIPVAELHDAKVDKYANLDYTDPTKSVIDKSIAKQFKTLVEDNTSSVDVKALNKELSQHYAVQDLLEKLNGKVVEGGKLGKYFAQVVGGGVGSYFGPLGTIVGSEVGSMLKGQQLKGKFSGATGQGLETSPAMRQAVESGKGYEKGYVKPKPTPPPQLMLPAPKEGMPKASNNVPINLPERTQSTLDAREVAKIQKVEAKLSGNALTDEIMKYPRKVEKAGGWTPAKVAEFKGLVEQAKKESEGSGSKAVPKAVQNLSPLETKVLTRKINTYSSFQDFIDKYFDWKDGAKTSTEPVTGKVLTKVQAKELFNLFKKKA